MNNKVILSAKDIVKNFIQGDRTIKVLNQATLEIKSGEILALVGPSGSGKSTFLQIAGLLEKPDEGEIIINGINCSNADDKTRTNIRKNEIGVIYQFHHLLPEFSALENVVIPQMLKSVSKKQAQEKAQELLTIMGLAHRLNHRPAELSGGEQQRVAISRALINKPSLLLADEPTGNLDPHTAEDVYNLLLTTARLQQVAILFVTHNMELAKRATRVVKIIDGTLCE